MHRVLYVFLPDWPIDRLRRGGLLPIVKDGAGPASKPPDTAPPRGRPGPVSAMGPGLRLDGDEETNELPFATVIAAQGRQDSIEVVGAKFEDVTVQGDVVYFEFCFHEMDDPESALLHAKSLAPDLVVYDHSPGSEWIYYGAEETNVLRSSAVMARFGIRRRQTFHAEQQFGDYAELLAKVSPQGALAIERIQRFATATNIIIPMSYELNLL